MSEHHLFIIWEHARDQEKEILLDIAGSFDITHKFDIGWSKKFFSDNLSRFYGTNLPAGSEKETHIGTGRFLLVIVEDKSPIYKQHNTSRGAEVVNSRTFLSKTKYRDLTGGGHKIHGTNNEQEFQHDLRLLLGMNLSELHKRYGVSNSKTVFIDQDVIGADGWESLWSVLYTLNETIDYVVMRNYEPLPDRYYAGTHGDIDLLVDDYDNAKLILNAKAVFPEAHRVHNKIIVAGEEVLIDIRYVGDNYYDKDWQKDMLNTKILHNNFNVMNSTNHYYSLLYHAIIHKSVVAQDYIDTLQSIKNHKSKTNHKQFNIKQAIKDLSIYLADNNYTLTLPEPSVYWNLTNVRLVNDNILEEKIKREFHLKNIKKLSSSSDHSNFSGYYRSTDDNTDYFIKVDTHDLKHENDIAKKVYNKNKKHFVEPIEYRSGDPSMMLSRWSEGINLEEYMTQKSVSKASKKALIKDLYEIFEELYDLKIVHRDIIPRNFIVTSESLKLVDFHYAVEYDSYKEPDYARDDIASLGRLGESFAYGIFRWDDAFSFVKIAEYILGIVEANKTPLVREMTKKIGARVITPEGEIFRDTFNALYKKIGEQDTHISNQERLIVDKQSIIQDKDKAISELERALDCIIRSKTYKLGRMVSFPYRLLNRIRQR